ncbi:MAG: winged helix-turn-helix domain-containing protein [bacterium]
MTSIGLRRATAESAPFTRVVCIVADEPTRARVEFVLRDELTTVAQLPSWMELENVDTVPDMLVLDGRLSEVTSMRSLLTLRRRWPCIGIVAIEVPGEDAATQLLGWGVDDAIESRCSGEHFSARLGAAARRARTENASLRRRIGDVVYDRDSRRVWCDGDEVAFAPRELAVLDCLWRRAGEFVGHDTLHDFVWAGDNQKTRTNRVEVYISYVRRKLRRSQDVAIETLRGRGYRLVRRDELSA